GGINVLQISKLAIFDRWGNLVFEKQNFLPNEQLEGWDGRHKGRMAAQGIYLFQAVVEFSNGKERIFAGDVLLLR
ncbi:MAG: gliding motility-associated C-terminal domain-containing protein, partial [Bacteroidota bacterium]